MMPLSIRCNHISSLQDVSDAQFFILKGDNAGKPGLERWTNSFVATASDAEMKDFYFWLSHLICSKLKALKYFTGDLLFPLLPCTKQGVW